MTIARSSCEDGSIWYTEQLGYAKIAGKWGLAIQTEEGGYGIEPDYETFSFNDAPRQLRVKAIETIPDLLEKMILVANETSAKIEQKIVEVHQIEFALNPIPTPAPQPPAVPYRAVTSTRVKAVAAEQTQPEVLPQKRLPLLPIKKQGGI